MKKAPFFGAFFYSCLILFGHANSYASPQPCSSKQYDFSAIVKHVVDGDTVVLENNTSVRLIGINTPELDHKLGHHEPMAAEARDWLANRLQGKKINLRYDKEHYDRYQRTLAHVFLEDGTNVNAEMVESGLAAQIAIPPNLWSTACYADLENRARKSKLGIWNQERFQPKDASTFTQRQNGFYLAEGRIKNITSDRHKIWLEVDSRFSFRIDREDLEYFKSLPPESLLGHKIIVRGWTFPYMRGVTMRIRHPLAIQLVD